MASFTTLFSSSTYTKVDPVDELHTATGCLTEQFGLPKEKTLSEVDYFIHYVRAATESFDSLINKLSASELSQFPTLSKLSRIYKVLPPHNHGKNKNCSPQ